MTQTPAQTQPPALPPELDPRLRPGRRRRGRVTRVLSWVAGITSLVVLLAATGLYVAWHHYNGRIQRIDTQLPGATAAAPPADTAAQNILLVGSDTREGKGDQGFGAKKGSARYVAGQRSDTIILLHVPAGRAKATMVSFPRDSWVEIPDYTDPTTGKHYPAHHQRINSAFELGGAPLLVATVQELSGLRVDHYIQVDFAGFQDMVNALGGVTVCVKTTRHDKDSGDNLTAGTHHVNGAQALSFVRDRKGLPRGDLDRIADQQYFLSTLLHKVLSAGTLANPFKLNAFLNATTTSLAFDREFSRQDLLSFALRMRHLDPKHVALTTVPVADASANINGADVVLLDDAKMAALFDSLKGNRTKSATPALTVPPAQVQVAVYNGAGRAGLAGQARRDLRTVGFEVTSIGNAGSGTATSEVRYGPGQEAAARTLAAAVPGSVLRADPSLGTTLHLVVGSSYAGARSVTVGSATPKPAASKGAGTGTTTAAAAANSCAP